VAAWIQFFIALLAAAVFELAWDAAVSPWIAPPNLIQIIAAAVALHAGYRRGALVGALAGLLGDLLQARPSGIETLSGALMGLAAGFLGRRIIVEGFWARWSALTALVALEAAARMVGDWALLAMLESSLLAQGKTLMAHAIPQLDMTGALMAGVLWPVWARPVGRIRIPSGPPEPKSKARLTLVD